MPQVIKDWIHEHDSRWSFILPYIAIAVMLGIFASLFWVAVVMFSHFLLELWRHRMLGTENAILHSLWHTKLDFGLVIMGLTLALYSDVVFGLLGLGQAARGTAALGRVVVIQRAMRGVLLSVDDAGLLARGLFKAIKHKVMKAEDGQLTDIQAENPAIARDGRSTTDPATGLNVTGHAGEDLHPWRKPTKGDWFGLGLGVVSLGLILMAPVLTDHDWARVIGLILAEMTP